MKRASLLLALTALLLGGLSGCASSRTKPASAAKVESAAKNTPGAGASTGQADPGVAGTPRKDGSQPPPGKPAQAGAKTVAAAGPAPAPPAASPSAATPPAAAPLIMENADRMEGFRSRGEYVLSGKVRFSHAGMRLETEKAVWLKDQNRVYCESGMRLTQRGSVLTAEKGSYDKNMGQATADGNVKMKDSSGEVEAFGGSLLYQRKSHVATLSGKPMLRRIYAKKADSAAAAQGAAGPKDKAKPEKDTLVIRGDRLTYDDSSQVAVAEGSVVITRDKMKITCARAEYHDRSDSLYLLGDPTVMVDDSRIKGKNMRMGMHGEEINSLLVKGEAQAHSVEAATDTSVARESDVRGDSLFLAFRQKAIDSVQVFRNAHGAYYDVDKPDYVNRMSGDYMVLRFDDGQVASANVLGGAKSVYFHLEKKALKGRNEAEGDTIDFAFRDGKVDEVMVKGQAKGTYFGEKAAKSSPKATPGPGEPGPMRRK